VHRYTFIDLLTPSALVAQGCTLSAHPAPAAGPATQLALRPLWEASAGLLDGLTADRTGNAGFPQGSNDSPNLRSLDKAN